MTMANENYSPDPLTGLIKPLLNTVSGFGQGFLADPATEAPLGMSDRVTAFGAGSSIVVDQASVVPQVQPGQRQARPMDPSMNEPPVVSRMLTDHFFRLAVNTWKPSDPSLHQGRKMRLLFNLPIPQAFFQTTTGDPSDGSPPLFAPVAVLQYYRFLRTSFEFVLQANALPFTEGQLLMWYEPVFEEGLLEADGRPGRDFTWWKSFFSVFNFPHGFLNLYVNSSVRMAIPFTFFENGFDLIMQKDEGKLLNKTLGHLKVAVMNPLRTNEMSDTTAVDVTLLGRMVNAELTGLRPFHKLPFYAVHKDVEGVGSNPFSGGQDPPIRLLNTGVNIQPGLGSMHMANAEETSRTHSLALAPVAAAPDTTSFGFDATGDLLEFAKIPSLVMWTAWQDVWGPGQLLFELPVTPRLEFYKYPDFSTELETSNETFTGNLSALSHLYSAWRGTIIFKFQVVMSSFHRGRFGVFFVPGATYGDPIPTLAQLQSSRFALFDLGVESTFSFAVPFMDSRPYVNTTTYGWCTDTDPNLSGSSSGVPKIHVKSGAVFFHDAYTLTNTTGMLYVMVINQLQSTGTVAHSIDVNVFTVAGDDFQFFFPVETDFSLTIEKKSADQEVLKAGDTSTSGGENPQPVQAASGALAPPVSGAVGSIEDAQTGLMPTPHDPTIIERLDVVFSYSHTDMKRMLGRAHYYTDRAFTVNDSVVRKVYLMRLMAPELGTLGVIFSMHTFWRGPVTLHLSPNGTIPSRAVFLVAVLPQGSACPLSLSSILASGATAWDMSSSQNITVEVPYYVNTTGLLCEREYLGMNHSNPRAPLVLGHLVLFPLKWDSGRFSFQIAMSMHREFVLTAKRPTPVMHTFLSYTMQSVSIDPSRQGIQRSIPRFQGSQPWIEITAEAVAGVSKASGDGVVKVQKDAWLVKKKKPLYDHYGVLVGSNVISEDAVGSDLVVAMLKGQCVFKEEPMDPSWIMVCESKLPFSDETALGLVGEVIPYSLTKQNCEHVARFIVSGESSSEQVRRVKKVTLGLSVAAGVAALGSLGSCALISNDVVKDGKFLEKVVGIDSKRLCETLSKVDEACTAISSFQTSLPNLKEQVESLKNFFPDVSTAFIQKIAGLLCKFAGYATLIAVNQNVATLMSVLLCISGDVLVEVGSARFIGAVNSLIACVKEGLSGIDPITTAATEVAIGMCGAPEVMRDSCVKELLPHLRDFNTLSLAWRNVEWIFTKFMELVSKALQFLSKAFHFQASCLVNNNKSVVDWMADVEALRAEVEAKDFSPSATYYCKLDRVNAYADNLVRTRALWDKDDKVAAALRWSFMEVKRLYQRYAECLPARAEPVVIMLSGPPGQGKSLLSTYLAYDLCCLHGLDPEKEIYNKPPGAQYYDGYRGQLVHVIDDIGQDPEDKDWADFTMLVSTTVFRPNMASLDDKGQPYRSRYVILTTNFPHIPPSSLRSIEAVQRRVFRHVEVTVKDEYMNKSGTLDFQKACEKEVAVSMSCCDCTLVDCGESRTGAATSIPRGGTTLRQLALDAFAESGRREGLFSSNMSARKKFQESAYAGVGRAAVMKDVGCSHGSGTKTLDVLLKEYKSCYGAIGLDRPLEPCEGPLANPFLTGAYSRPVSENWRKIRDALLKVLNEMARAPVWFRVALVCSSIMSIAGIGASIALYRKAAAIEEKLDMTSPDDKDGVYAGPPNKVVTLKPSVRMEMTVRKDSENIESIVKMSKNMCMLTFTPFKGDPAKMRGLFIGCDILLVPSHLFEHAPGMLEIVWGEDHVSIPVGERLPRDGLSLYVNEQPTDLVAFRVGGLRHHAPKIVGQVASASMLQNLPKNGCLMHLKNSDAVGDVFCLQATDIQVHGKIVAEGEQLSAAGVRYTCIASRGFCGQPLMALYPEGYRAIGIHVASCVGLCSYAIPISKEVIETLINQLAVRKDFAPGVEIIYEIPRPVFVPSRSSLMSTGICTSIRAPALMGVEAVEPSFEKYNRKWPENVPSQAVTQALVRRYQGVLGEIPQLTYAQAIWGEGTSLAPIDNNTSAGYPYLLYGKRKEDLYPDPDFQADVLETLEGEREVIFTTFFKDELRPIDKVLAGKTRLIDAAPVNFTVAFRMAYGGFLARMHDCFGYRSHHMVGCDPELDWTNLYWDLSAVGSRAFAMDYSAFDSSCSRNMIRWAGDVVSEVSGVSKQHLFDSIAIGRRVFKKDVYETGGGLPSGTPCTSILDSVINTALIYQAIEDVSPGFDFTKIDEVVRFVVYGDDVLLVTSHNFPLSPEDMVATAARFGFKITGAKKGEGVSCVTLDECVFLKRGFRHEPDRPTLIHPTIDIDTTITDLVAWRRKGADQIDNLNTALAFAYHHGREIYDMIHGLCLRKARIDQLWSFEYLDARWKKNFE
uniref:Genome polyprotein n=1 Tax=Chameleon picornavirus 1 TaxID=2961775 RepID=A0A9N7AAQ2_9PICO|nr:TPA_asm: polyprotein [Chameleon picornavirus 1]